MALGTRGGAGGGGSDANHDGGNDDDDDGDDDDDDGDDDGEIVFGQVGRATIHAGIYCTFFCPKILPI